MERRYSSGSVEIERCAVQSELNAVLFSDDVSYGFGSMIGYSVSGVRNDDLYLYAIRQRFTNGGFPTDS
ncbi:MAG: hypothetical protein IPL18_14345 [Sphingomonadales bacterium]|nr:hypothetical protein [Sphingomonadales bacterium]